jgi:hypothetical protein
MSQHTPGPWTLRKGRGVSVPWAIEGEGLTLAEVYWSTHMDGDADANARLIAAAPEMRETLGEVAMLLRTTLRGYADEPWARRVLALTTERGADAVR